MPGSTSSAHASITATMSVADARHAERPPGHAVLVVVGEPDRQVATLVGVSVKVGQQIGEVESTKTTSTIYTPVSGTVSQINTDLKDHPEVVNSDPYGKGWMAVIELADSGEVDQLMTASQYEAFLASQKKG